MKYKEQKKNGTKARIIPRSSKGVEKGEEIGHKRRKIKGGKGGLKGLITSEY